MSGGILLQRVTDPAKIVTDEQVRAHLIEQGIDPDYVEFYKDYSKDFPRSKLYRDLKSGKRVVAISGLDRYNKFGHRMVPRWYKNRVGDYVGGANHLICRVAPNGHTDVWDGKGKHTAWNPVVYLDGVEQRVSLPTLLPVDPENENYQENTIEWDYGICKRRLRLIEGILAEWFVFDKDPGGDVRIEANGEGDLPPRPYFAIDAEGRELQGFEADSTAKVVPREAFSNVKYPVLVDDSYTGYSIANDGYIVASYESSCTDAMNATSGAVKSTSYYIEAGFWYDGSRSWFGYRAMLFFDTSSIPSGATMSSGTLYLRRYSGGYGDYYIRTGISSAYPHNPISSGDYNKAYITGNGGHGKSAYGGYGSIALNSTGLTWIVPGGTTKFYLVYYNDYAGTCDDHYGSVYPGEKGAGYAPKLVLSYTAPTPPTVSTQAASSIGVDHATGNGDITDDGGASITGHGMIWKAGADPVDIASCDDYSDEGAGAVGAFTSLMSGLSPGTLYYCRAYAINSQGTSYGAAVSFTTAAPITKPVDADALLRGLGLTSANSDALLRSSGSGLALADAFLEAVRTLGITLDAYSTSELSSVVAIDSLVRGVLTSSLPADALARIEQLTVIDANALLQGAFSKLFDADAVAMIADTLGVSADTIISALPVAVLSADLLIAKALSETMYADVALAIQPTITSALSAAISYTEAFSAIADVLSRAARVLEVASSVGLCGTVVGQLVSDALLSASKQVALGADGLVFGHEVTDFVSDAALTIAQVTILGADSVAVSPLSVDIPAVFSTLWIGNLDLSVAVFISAPPLLVGGTGFGNRKHKSGFSGRKVDGEVI